MARQLRALTALADDSTLVPSTHIRQLTITCNFSSKGFDALFWTPQNLHSCAHTCTQRYRYTQTCIILNLIKIKTDHEDNV